MKKTLSFIILLFCFGIQSVYAQWSAIDDYPGINTYGACSFSINTSYYVAGGVYINGLYEYDVLTNTWSEKTSIPGGFDYRLYLIGFNIGGSAYVGGGNYFQDENYAKSDFYKYNPIDDSWEAIDDFGGGPRSRAFSCSVGDKGYVIGGTDGNDDATKEVWEYDSNLDEWTQKANFPTTNSAYTTGFVIDDKIYVAAGSNDIFTSNIGSNSFYEYTPATDTWVQKADVPGPEKYGCAGFSAFNVGYIGGGKKNDFSFERKFYSYNPSNDSWQEVNDLIFPENSGVAHSVAGNVGQHVFMGTGSFHIDNPSATAFSRSFYTTTRWGLGLEENHKMINLYPNPSTDFIHIENKGTQENIKLSIKDITGQQVYSSNKIEPTIDISMLASGLYILSITDITGNENVQQFIKK